MKKYFFSAIFLISSQVLASDPYMAIERVILKNGMTVTYAPSEETNLTAIRIDVGVGFEAEDASNRGVSHLLEHSLFRNKILQDDMTYLQLIKEAGGEANGTTSPRSTAYFASIPSKKGEWLLENFATMILKPNLIESYIEKEKTTVEMEIGKPTPIVQFLGFNPMQILKPQYLSRPNFWEQEFGLKLPPTYTIEDEQLSNQRLTLEQVKKQYSDYYYPSNMNLYIAGKFDRKKMESIVAKTWGALPASQGKKLPPLALPTMREKPYVGTTITQDNPTAQIGTKVVNFNLKEELILASYTDYLAHDLMKELRNKKGQTYTAYAVNDFYNGYGTAYITFQSREEHLTENLLQVKAILKKDAEEGKISKERVEEAKKLYISQFQLRGREAHVMLDYALFYNSIVTQFGHFESPYSIIKNVKTEEYAQTLKKFFKPSARYEFQARNHYFFFYDHLVVLVIGAIAAFMGLRTLLTKPFQHHAIRWVRKVKFPPLKSLEFAMLVSGYFAYVHIEFVMTLFFSQFSFFNSSLLFNEYLWPVLCLGGCVTTMMFFLCSLPSKLMVVSDRLVIKSISYYSTQLSIADIHSLETVSLFQFFWKLHFLKVGPRFSFFNFKFWKKGLIVHLKNGKSDYFGLDHADEACAELAPYLEHKITPEKLHQEAA